MPRRGQVSTHRFPLNSRLNRIENPKIGNGDSIRINWMLRLPSLHNLFNTRQNSRLKGALNTTLHTHYQRWLDRIHLQTNFLTVSSWTRRSMKTSWWAGLLMQNQTVISTEILQWWLEMKATRRNGEQNRLDMVERVNERLKSKPSERETCIITIPSQDTVPSKMTSTLLQILELMQTIVLWSIVVRQLLIYPSNKWPQSTMPSSLAQSSQFQNATLVSTIEIWIAAHWLVSTLKLQMWVDILTGK